MADHEAFPLDPPHQVFLVDDDGEAVEQPLRRPEDLAPGASVCIKNPWRPDAFARGTVRGKPDAIVLELGQALGPLELDEELGWVCRGLVKKQSIFAGLAEEMVEQATETAYTEALMKKMSGKK